MSTAPLSTASSRRAARLVSVLTVVCAVTWCLLVFGATVRVHGAGLACPDWPLCFGELVPQLNFQVFLEWGHRLLAGLVSLGFVGVAVVLLRDPALRARTGGLVAVAALTLALQVVLGGLTVLHLLAFWSVTLHLLTGNLFLALLLGLRAHLLPQSGQVVSVAARGVVTVCVLGVFGQLALGGLVSSNYAGLACTEWPSCNGGIWFPAWSGPIGIQVVHRLGAYTLTAVLLAGRVLLRGDPQLRRGADLALVLVLVQVLVGISNVLLGMPVELAILHAAVGDALAAVVVVNAWRAWTRPLAAPTTQAVSAWSGGR